MKTNLFNWGIRFQFDLCGEDGVVVVGTCEQSVRLVHNRISSEKQSKFINIHMLWCRAPSSELRAAAH